MRVPRGVPALPPPSRHRPRGRRMLAGVMLVAGLGAGAAACGGSSSASSTTTTEKVPVVYVKVDGHKVRVPVEPDGSLPIAGPGTGDQVVITSGGFAPNHLFARVKVPITFTNLTDQPQQITFEHFSVQSPKIAPGKTWKWTPQTGISIVYQSQSGASGILDIGELP
jgi:hypothetical protein